LKQSANYGKKNKNRQGEYFDAAFNRMRQNILLLFKYFAKDIKDFNKML